ncbi:MAG: hypothetical protein ACRDE8_12790 [Ginsengibacter sp.]
MQIVVTSAGNPSTFTQFLKQHGIKVMHVVSSSRFAKKAEARVVTLQLLKVLRREAIMEEKKLQPWYCCRLFANR